MLKLTDGGSSYSAINQIRIQPLKIIISLVSVLLLCYVTHLLTLHSVFLMDESEERAVFRGGHPSKYWPPSKVCAV
jgi:hypothetical protein